MRLTKKDSLILFCLIGIYMSTYQPLPCNLSFISSYTGHSRENTGNYNVRAIDFRANPVHIFLLKNIYEIINNSI